MIYYRIMIAAFILFAIFMMSEYHNGWYDIDPRNYLAYRYDGDKSTDALLSYSGYLGEGANTAILKSNGIKYYGVIFGNRNNYYVEMTRLNSKFEIRQIDYNELLKRTNWKPRFYDSRYN